ncbi:N-acetyltransferase [Maribius pontilimi]|uniref:N-acetyltransferase n=1 Tax=Palleronia pontilimi TaxID=1964209 RepID=A0A934IIK5_9RHOB|nr:N-acetyltransferase [Palleronia pontilimi]MBJ3762584.1 N-acetyltransferase [Palleronia pontilimi]
MVAIEAPTDHDWAAIEGLLCVAFGQQDESDLVAALRRDRAIARERIAVMDARIVGYAALSAMRAPAGWLCLAPVAVQPERQGGGIGSALVRTLLAGAEGPVVVLGDPEFYGRLGFSAGAARNLVSPYPLSHTLLAGLDGAPADRLIYPAAFG